MRDWRTTSGRGSSSESDPRDPGANEARSVAERHGVGSAGFTPAGYPGRSVALVVGLLAATGACTNNDRPIVNIDVIDRSGRALDKPAIALLDEAALEAAATKSVSSLRGFQIRKAKSDEVGWQLTLEVAMMLERPPVVGEGEAVPEGQVHRAAGVLLTLASLGTPKSGGVPARFEGDGVVAKNVTLATPFQTLVLEAVDEASRSLSATIRLAEAKDGEVLAALSSDERGLKRRAIVMSGERKLKDAVPRLSDIIRDAAEDQDSVLKSIGSLVAIGDERAVGPLIDAGRQRPSAYLAQILFAVGSLGGKEAEAYLFTVSNGHADPEVRKNASDALAELERRRTGGKDGEGDRAREPE